MLETNISEKTKKKSRLDSIEYQISNLTNGHVKYIDSLIKHILNTTTQADPELLETYNPDKFKTKLENLDSILSYITVSNILIGDELKPNRGKWTAIELKRNLSSYNERFKIISGRPTVGLNVNLDHLYIHEIPLPWELVYFYHIPLIEVLSYLKDIQIRLRENQYALMHST